MEPETAQLLVILENATPELPLFVLRLQEATLSQQEIMLALQLDVMLVNVIIMVHQVV